LFKKVIVTLGAGWIKPVTLTTWEAEIRKNMVQSQPRHTVPATPCLEKTLHKKRSGGVAEGVGPEFKPETHQKKKKKEAVFNNHNCFNWEGFWGLSYILVTACL
jgi:hypothetical protein